MEATTYWLKARWQQGRIDASIFKILPYRENVLHRPLARSADGPGRIAQIQQLLEIALQMRPADLPRLQRQLSVGTPAIGTDNAHDLSQQRLKPFRAAFGVDLECDGTAGGGHPKPA